MKSFIESHIGLMLIGSTFVGLLFPAAALLPHYTITIMLAVVIFIACLRIELQDFSEIAWGKIILFWIARFIVLPLAMFAVLGHFFPVYAAGILLVCLLPAATGSSAFTNVFGGNVPTALLLTIVSSIASVLLIPLLFETVAHEHLNAPISKLFLTLAETILLPAVLAIPARKVAHLQTLSNSHGKVTSILILAGMSVIIIAGQRQTILFEPSSLIRPAFLAVACYLVFMIAGLPLFRRSPQNRIAVFTCSAYINTALGMTLALANFPREVVLTMVMAQLCWTALPLATNPMIRRMKLTKLDHI